MVIADLPHRPSVTRERSVAPVDSETDASRWFADYVDAGRAKLSFPLRDLRRTIGVMRALRTLPVLRADPSDVGDGPFIRAALRRPFVVRTALASATSALVIPADVRTYSSGRPKHALRQKLRNAESMGLRCREIDDAYERAALLSEADEYERNSAVDSMRNPDASNDDLLDLQQWLLVESSKGAPLLLAVAAVDGDLAVLRYYRTLAGDEEASVARYAAMPELVQVLSRAGVRWLVETGRPHWIHNGVRQFQRKVGFRLVRVAVARASRAR